MPRPSPFRYFKTSPEVIRLAVMLYVRFPLSLRNVEDLLHERGIEISHETVCFWWNRFGPMLAGEGPVAARRVAPSLAGQRPQGGKASNPGLCKGVQMPPMPRPTATAGWTELAGPEQRDFGRVAGVLPARCLTYWA